MVVVVVVAPGGLLQLQFIRCHPYAFSPRDEGVSASLSQVVSPRELGKVGVAGPGVGRHVLSMF